MRRLIALGVALPAMAPMGALAADWELNPRVEAGYLFDDNYRLTQPGTEIEVQGPLVDASLEMRARQASGSEFSFTPRVRATYFPDATELDSVNYYGTLDWLHHGQRLTTDLLGEFSQEDVVNSEQPSAEIPPDAGLGQPDIGDSGRVLVPNRRTRYSLQPTFSYEMSARREIEFGGNFADVSYDHQIPGAQLDYQNFGAYTGLVTRFSPANSLTVRARGAHYDMQVQGTATAYGAELQWDTHNAAGTQKYLRLGAQNVDLPIGGSEVAWVAGGGASVLMGRHTLFVDLSRDVGPSSSGIVVARDALRFRWSFDMTPRMAFLAGIRGTHDDDVNPDSLFRARSYATGDVGFQWRWQEEFSLHFSYDYTWQKFDDGLNDPAKSNGATLTFLYQPVQRRR